MELSSGTGLLVKKSLNNQGIFCKTFHTNMSSVWNIDQFLNRILSYWLAGAHVSRDGNRISTETVRFAWNGRQTSSPVSDEVNAGRKTTSFVYLSQCRQEDDFIDLPAVCNPERHPLNGTVSDEKMTLCHSISSDMGPYGMRRWRSDTQLVQIWFLARLATILQT